MQKETPREAVVKSSLLTEEEKEQSIKQGLSVYQKRTFTDKYGAHRPHLEACCSTDMTEAAESIQVLIYEVRKLSALLEAKL